MDVQQAIGPVAGIRADRNTAEAELLPVGRRLPPTIPASNQFTGPVTKQQPAKQAERNDADIDAEMAWGVSTGSSSVARRRQSDQRASTKTTTRSGAANILDQPRFEVAGNGNRNDDNNGFNRRRSRFMTSTTTTANPFDDHGQRHARVPGTIGSDRQTTASARLVGVQLEHQDHGPPSSLGSGGSGPRRPTPWRGR